MQKCQHDEARILTPVDLTVFIVYDGQVLSTMSLWVSETDASKSRKA